MLCRFTTVSLKVLSDQVWIRYKRCCFFKLLFSFAVSLRNWHLMRLRSNGETNRSKHFLRVRKPTLSSTFLIRIRIPGYHYKSGIGMFAWRVTLKKYYHDNNYNILIFNYNQVAKWKSGEYWSSSLGRSGSQE